MGCFPVFSEDNYPVKYLSRGGSKIWRRVSGRNSARYSLRQAFKKNEDFRSSKYKKIEPKKNVKENFELDQDTEQLEACDENNNNYQIQYNEQLVEVHPHSETSSDSEPNQTVIEDIAITNNNKNCEDQNEANFQTAAIEQETDCEYENKINGLLVTKSEYGSSEVDEEDVSKKTGKNNKYQKFKAKKPSCSSLNRISPDYDLINYSSINLEDLISGGSDSNSDNQSDKLTEVVKPSEPKKTDSISDSTSSEGTICASENKADDEIIAGTKTKNQNKIQPENKVHQIPNKTSTLKKTDLEIVSDIQENYFNMLSSIEFEDTNSQVPNCIDLDLDKNTKGIINKNNIDENKERESDISDSSSESNYFSCEEIKSEKSSPNSEELAANTDSSYESLPIGSIEKIDEDQSDLAIEENCDNQRQILSTTESAMEERESSSHDGSEYTDVKIDEDSSDGKTNEPIKPIEIEKEIKSESSCNVVSDPHMKVNEENPDEINTKSIKIGNQIITDEQEENITQLSRNIRYEIDENTTQNFSYINLENLTETCIDSLSDIIDGRSILNANEVESGVLDSYKSNHENNQEHTIEIQTSEGFGGGNSEKDEMDNFSEFEEKTGDSTAVKLVENEDNEPIGKFIEDVDQTTMESHEPKGDEMEDTDEVNQKPKAFQRLPENSKAIESIQAINENDDAQTNLSTNYVEYPKNYLNDIIISLFENSSKLQEKLTNMDNGGKLKPAKTDVTTPNPDDKQLTHNLFENTEVVKPEEDNKQSQKNFKIEQLPDPENSTNIQTENENEKDNINPATSVVANTQQNCQNAPLTNQIEIATTSENAPTVKTDDIDEITPLKPNMVQPLPPKSDRRKKLLSFRLLGADDSFNKSSLMHLYDLMEQSHENLELISTPTNEMVSTRFIINTFEPSKPRRQSCKLVAVI